MNSIRKKLKSVQEIIQNTFDIFLVCETKIDSSFPNQQFRIREYRIFRKSRDARDGGLLFYVNQNLNCKVLNKYPMGQGPEILVLKLKLTKTNWLLIVSYKTPSLSDITFTFEVSNILTFYRSTHDNILLMGELVDGHEPCTLISEPTRRNFSLVARYSL